MASLDKDFPRPWSLPSTGPRSLFDMALYAISLGSYTNSAEDMTEVLKSISPVLLDTIWQRLSRLNLRLSFPMWRAFSKLLLAEMESDLRPGVTPARSVPAKLVGFEKQFSFCPYNLKDHIAQWDSPGLDFLTHVTIHCPVLHSLGPGGLSSSSAPDFDMTKSDIERLSSLKNLGVLKITLADELSPRPPTECDGLLEHWTAQPGVFPVLRSLHLAEGLTVSPKAVASISKFPALKIFRSDRAARGQFEDDLGPVGAQGWILVHWFGSSRREARARVFADLISASRVNRFTSRRGREEFHLVPESHHVLRPPRIGRGEQGGDRGEDGERGSGTAAAAAEGSPTELEPRPDAASERKEWDGLKATWQGYEDAMMHRGLRGHKDTHLPRCLEHVGSIFRYLECHLIRLGVGPLLKEAWCPDYAILGMACDDDDLRRHGLEWKSRVMAGRLRLPPRPMVRVEFGKPKDPGSSRPCLPVCLMRIPQLRISRADLARTS